MRMTAQKTELQPPMSDTVHLSNLKLAERSMTHSPTPTAGEGKIEGLQTDVVMLQKADVWMSQFKTRLN
ncbi:MAG: hypothetical protein M3Q07_25140, partial [Pseudobdellovibrionaceae bacterium]|nr:hypothetical protein [Pseudobdellovibrionaceae bacterium]